MSEKKKLRTIYNDYDFSGLTDFYYQDFRESDGGYEDISELIRKKLLENWEKNQPLGGGKKSDEQIVKDFQSLLTLNIDVTTEEGSSKLDVLKYFGKAPSGINQYFPEMLDTPISLGNKSLSVMDVIKTKEAFHKFFHSIVYNDRMYTFTMWYGWEGKYDLKNPESDEINQRTEEFKIELLNRIIPEETWKIVGDKIPYFFRSYNKTEKDKIGKLDDPKNLDDKESFYGYKLPFYLKKTDDFGNVLYYKLDMESYKSEFERDWKKNKRIPENVPQIKYIESNEIDYNNNMRIFPQITQSFRLGGGSQPVSNFSAGIARFLIMEGFDNSLKYNLIENDTFVVLDTSTGWAGRLVGLLSCYSGMRKRYLDEYNKELKVVYLTTDPNEQIKDRYNTIIDDWFEVIEPNSNKDYFIFHKAILGSETPEFLSFCKDKLNELNVKGCNMGLTSPPYFNRERYGEDTSETSDKVIKTDNQSWNKYRKYENWSESFLKPTIKNISELLVDKGIFYMNIANIKGGSSLLLLEDDTIKYGNEFSLNCNNERKYKMLMSIMTGNNGMNRDTGGRPHNSVTLTTTKTTKNKKGETIIVKDVKHQKYEPIFLLVKNGVESECKKLIKDVKLSTETTDELSESTETTELPISTTNISVSNVETGIDTSWFD